ncbi:MAG TPA: acyltransferase [Thermoguttaceae bacterium]
MRILALDVIRAVAILLVLGRHACWPSTSGPIGYWAENGWLGVDLFFVLSGFLVSGLLFKNPSPLVFYYRRGFKIYPSYWALLLVTAFITNVPATQYITDFLFFQSYTEPIWAHTWSLAVEEHFYFILPLFLLTGFYLGAGMLISALVCGGITVNTITKSLGYVGVFSYSIYLWHPLVLVWIVPKFVPKTSWLGVGLYFALSILLGILLAKIIEFPCLKIRDYKFIKEKTCESSSPSSVVQAGCPPCLRKSGLAHRC